MIIQFCVSFCFPGLNLCVSQSMFWCLFFTHNFPLLFGILVLQIFRTSIKIFTLDLKYQSGKKIQIQNKFLYRNYKPKKHIIKNSDAQQDPQILIYEDLYKNIQNVTYTHKKDIISHLIRSPIMSSLVYLYVSFL